MKKDGSIVSVIAVCIIGLAVVMFVGLKKRPMIVENQATADVFQTSGEANPEDPQSSENRFPKINTVLVDNGRLIIGAQDGIYVKPNLDEGPVTRRESGVELMYLNAILPVGDQRYVGGTGLYLLDENYSLLIDEYDFGCRISALMEFGDGILVGSESGLWFHCDMPLEGDMAQDTLLKDGIIVTALAQDKGELWVGTYGDGLYRFDGQTWQQRFLERDTTMFDFVSALEYYYPNLWVGTEQAIFRYDGGKWSQMFVADSSETYNVTCIMATPAATYIGTDDGLLRFAKDTLAVSADFDGMEIVGLCRSEKGVIVATRNDGIFTYKGKEEIVSPEQLNPDFMAGNNETTAGTNPEIFSVPSETELAKADPIGGDTDY